jgi:hypothetical protein
MIPRGERGTHSDGRKEGQSSNWFRQSPDPWMDRLSQSVEQWPHGEVEQARHVRITDLSVESSFESLP